MLILNSLLTISSFPAYQKKGGYGNKEGRRDKKKGENTITLFLWD